MPPGPPCSAALDYRGSGRYYHNDYMANDWLEQKQGSILAKDLYPGWIISSLRSEFFVIVEP